MIGIDTNVLVRFVMQDDEEQARVADAFFSSLSSSNQGYLSLVTMVELVWVLQASYKQPRARIIAFIKQLFDVDSIVFENSTVLYTALESYQKGADFADALISASALMAGCTSVVTFDHKAASVLGMCLLAE